MLRFAAGDRRFRVVIDQTGAPQIALDDPSSFMQGQPHDQYAWLRGNHPVWWHPEATGRGFWAVTRYGDVQAVNRDTQTFSSWLGGVMLPDADEEQLRGSRLMMLFMDPPDHTRYRRLVSRSFTPRNAQSWKASIDSLAATIVDRASADGYCDLVGDVAGEMPSQVIARLMGIPGDDGRRLYHLTEVMHSSAPEVTDSDRLSAVIEMHTYATQVAADKLRHPGDDLASALLRAEMYGERLSEEEFNWFFLLLVNAGGDTTRNLISGGVEALLDQPDQMAKLQGDPEGLMASAVEELLRFVSPVVHMRRTASADASLAGTQIQAGDKVVLFYGSANRDESAWSNPDRLDLARSPNHHLAFGGGGPHMCLGAHFARIETAAVLREIATKWRDIELAGTIESLPSTFIAGLRHLPISFRLSSLNRLTH